MTHKLDSPERGSGDFNDEECLCPIMSGYGIKPARSDMYQDRSVFMAMNCKRHACEWWVLDKDYDGDCAVVMIAGIGK